MSPISCSLYYPHNIKGMTKTLGEGGVGHFINPHHKFREKHYSVEMMRDLHPAHYHSVLLPERHSFCK